MKETTQKKVQKFVDEYNKTLAEVYDGDNTMIMAEDVDTYYEITNVIILKTKIKFTTHYFNYFNDTYNEVVTDDDEMLDIIKQWRKDMNRARRYWAMDCETIDKITDGVIRDINAEDD